MSVLRHVLGPESKYDRRLPYTYEAKVAVTGVAGMSESWVCDTLCGLLEKLADRHAAPGEVTIREIRPEGEVPILVAHCLDAGGAWLRRPAACRMFEALYAGHEKSGRCCYRDRSRAADGPFVEYEPPPPRRTTEAEQFPRPPRRKSARRLGRAPPHTCAILPPSILLAAGSTGRAPDPGARPRRASHQRRQARGSRRRCRLGVTARARAPKEAKMEISASFVVRSPGVRPRAGMLRVMLLAALLADPPWADAAVFTVTRTDDQVDTAPGDGLCVALSGGCTLRAAVQEANSLFGADGIYIPAGTYSLTLPGAGEDLAASGDLDVTSNITLLGDGWAASTIAMTAALDRVFDVQGFASLELGDVTVTGGTIGGVGGGVYVHTGGGLVLRRSRIQACTAHHGGGIGTLGGTVLVEDSELAGNRASEAPPAWFARGPAIASDAQGAITVRRSSLHDNRTASTGSLRGIEIWNSSLTIESSSIVDDGAPGGSYSVGADTSDVVVVSSTLARLTVVGLGPPGATLSLGCSIVAYCTLTGGNVSYSNNGLNVFLDGLTCLGPNDTNGEWEVFSLWAPPGRFPARFPNAYSSAIDGGHTFVCAAIDQWSQIRPRDNDGDGIAVPEVGAVEGSVPFLDSFEIGSTATWSHTYD